MYVATLSPSRFTRQHRPFREDPSEQPDYPLLQQYQQLVLAESTLLHYWPMQDAAGSLVDAKAGKLLTKNGDPTYRYNTIAPPMGGFAIDFDGTGDYFTGTGMTAVISGDALTICGWYNIATEPLGADTMMEIRSAAGTWYRLYLNTGGAATYTIQPRFKNTSQVEVIDGSIASFSDVYDGWHFFAYIVTSNTSRRGYVDGNLKTIKTTDRSLAADMTIYSIGALDDGTSDGICKLCHWAVFDSALSEATLDAMYALATS